jgi:hypothetical protein
MANTLALPFAPKYTLNTRTVEGPNGFRLGGVSWSSEAKVRVNQAAAHSMKVGFIQVVKSYDIKIDYENSIVEGKLPSTPMCDTDPATDAPWYEASAVPIATGWSPEIMGPCNQIVTPKLGDHPSVQLPWFDSVGSAAKQVRRKQTFQTWLVVNDRTAHTWDTLYCFSYSIDQLVAVDVTKPVGQRTKVEVGASTQASAPTTYITAPFPKIPAQAHIQLCPNTSQVFTSTVRAP